MIPSPKVATYDKQPKMSVHGVAEKVAEVLKKGEHEFVMCNFAPPDMVSFSLPSSFLPPRIQLTPLPLPSNFHRSATLESMKPQSRRSPKRTRRSERYTRPRRRRGTSCSSRQTTATRSR